MKKLLVFQRRAVTPIILCFIRVHNLYVGRTVTRWHVYTSRVFVYIAVRDKRDKYKINNKKNNRIRASPEKK